MTTRADFEARGLATILDEVVALHHCTVKEILSRLRTSHVNTARRDLTMRLRALGFSYKAIGLLLGRDHTTCGELANRTKWKASKARNK